MQNQEFLWPSSHRKPIEVDGSWFGDSSIPDLEYFIKNISVVKGMEMRPDHIGSIITHYASKWLPELAGDDDMAADVAIASLDDSPESITASWTKKRFFIESLVAMLPPERDTIPCDFLLRLLRVASMVNVDHTCCLELEKRVSWQLDRASLKELMIPCFSHTATTLLDVNLVLRLAKRFVETEELAKSGAAVMKVAKLVDSYLAEVAVDSCLMLHEFIELASVVPSHARANDDALYRAIDTYLKAHQGLSKHERKTLFNLINTRKLSQEAYIHAAQNERLPIRGVVQLLLSEQTKLLKHHMDLSGSLSGARSPAGFGLDLSTRCISKRETMSAQQLEIKKLKEDVSRLQSQCIAMENRIEKLSAKKRGSSSYFSWKKLGIPVFKANRVAESEDEYGVARPRTGLETPLEMKESLLKGKNSYKRCSLN